MLLAAMHVHLQQSTTEQHSAAATVRLCDRLPSYHAPTPLHGTHPSTLKNPKSTVNKADKPLNPLQTTPIKQTHTHMYRKHMRASVVRMLLCH
jgi:hypothetical protein